MRAYTPKAVRDAEAYIIQKRGHSAIGLMKKAANEMFDAGKDTFLGASHICILCGKGNNAGDGYELARILKSLGKDTSCVRVFGQEPTTDIARLCYDEYLEMGGRITDVGESALKEIVRADVIVDAIFGIGYNGSIDTDSFLYKLIDVANNTSAMRIALDVPSGVNSDDGSVNGIAFMADVTLTVNVIKPGMLSYPGKRYCGNIKTIDIGIPQSTIDGFEEKCFIIPDDDYIKGCLKPKDAESNKGDFGKLLCICGCETMTGAGVMSVGAALRSGVGLVCLASEKSVIDIVKIKHSEPIYEFLNLNNDHEISAFTEKLNGYSAILVGCGLGKDEKKKRLVMSLINNYNGRLIIDADGINLISDNIDILKEAAGRVIITPHPGEFARISGYKTDYINNNRIKCATAFSEKYRCVTVLKGAGTVVAGDNICGINTTGNPGLAKGGSGDVLAGLIAGFAANKNNGLFDAALCGVYLHGKAADVLKKKYSEYGLLPSELPEEIAKLLP